MTAHVARLIAQSRRRQHVRTGLLPATEQSEDRDPITLRLCAIPAWRLDLVTRLSDFAL